MAALVEFALQYAARGWHVFPCRPRSKEPLTKRGFKDATTDRAIIESWWARWPDANIGIATGLSELVVLDCDGPEGLEQLAGLVRLHGHLPVTLAARTGRGVHIYLTGTGIKSSQIKGEHLDVRGNTGYAIAPPSIHPSGAAYAWVDPAAGVASVPEWVRGWAGNRRSADKPASPLAQSVPKGMQTGLHGGARPSLAERAIKAQTALPYSEAEANRLRSALTAIDASIDGATWFSYGAALHDLHWIVNGVDQGFEIWDEWSATSLGEGPGNGEYKGRADLEKRWAGFSKEYQGIRTTVASIFKAAQDAGWVAPVVEVKPEKVNGHNSVGELLAFPSQADSSNPLIELNQKYAVIGDLGGKCLVMSWVASKMHDDVKVPSFQTFKSFSERYGNRYIEVKNPDGDTKQVQLGAYWLKWKQRRSFDGLDLVPNERALLPGNVCNLWTGLAVAPVPGDWSLMLSHLRDVLAGGDAEAARYIVRFAAWCIQNPGKRAEVALVFRGGKGSGKGTFAHALRRIFGAHGLYISSAKHLIGQFNAHLRNCLLLYADEAFWAGDRAGESTLKALITESIMMIEQKGVDPQQWINRLHIVMTANAEWVVPASHDERRYAVFDVSNSRVGDNKYFAALYQQMHQGGLAAMLHDLMKLPLGDWHPRQIVSTAALQKQKAQSLPPLMEWWEYVLQSGHLPMRQVGHDKVKRVGSLTLLNMAREFAPKAYDLNPTRIGRLMRDYGALAKHTADGNYWRIPALNACREIWENKFGKWDWTSEISEWNAESDQK